MTILSDECKPTPMTRDAVVDLIREAAADANPEAPFWTFSSRRTAEAILSALSDAGMAVLPLRATDKMRDAGFSEVTQYPRATWDAMAAAFHPSQLETDRGPRWTKHMPATETKDE